MKSKNAYAKPSLKKVWVTPLSLAIAAALSSPIVYANNYDVTVANDTNSNTFGQFVGSDSCDEG